MKHTLDAMKHTIHTVKRALIYLRVSTAQQADKDTDPEGYSIPAQRDACQRKAASLGAEVVEEYIDRGESARTSDRPALQAMLRRIQQQQDIDYVIVHKVDRLARSRADDITIHLALKAAGVQLVSVTENIDETPSGKLLHGIMASIAEFYSANLAAEVIKGSTQKAKAGGTPYRAPLGYLNVRQHIDGHEIRTIALDPERAPLMCHAFEVYATGNYSLHQLLDELTDMGLTTKPTAKRPAKPLHLSHLAKLLHDPYYVGIVTYQGVHYPGKHPPLITPQQFERVQAVLKAHHISGDKRRIHHHYLKGTIYCARCGSRLTITHAKGNGGIYPYFFCLGRQRNSCNLPYLQIETIEQAIERFYAHIQLEPERIEALRTQLLQELDTERTHGAKQIQRQQARINKLERERRRLADCVLAGSVPDDIAAEKQDRIRRELAKAHQLLNAYHLAHEDIETTLTQALDLVGSCQAAYQAAKPEIRRGWNQILFTQLKIDQDRVTAAQLAPPFAALLAEDLTQRFHREAPWDKPRETDTTHEPLLVGHGSSKTPWVELRGIEPLASSMRPRRSTN
jgi:site-specific DNA recombinase